MPVYEFQCPKCGKIIVRDDIPITSPIKTIICDYCGEEAQKIISTSTFKLDGPGWYKDGYSQSSCKKESAPKK